MMTNCDPRIEAYMEAVETGKVEASKDVKALMKHVRKCFETEDIYVDQQQLTDYLGLARYFPYDEVFPWQQFVIGLHDCTYWRENGRPRWPDLFCLIGRGAGKDGTIALESTALASEYNGIRDMTLISVQTMRTRLSGRYRISLEHSSSLSGSKSSSDFLSGQGRKWSARAQGQQ